MIKFQKIAMVAVLALAVLAALYGIHQAHGARDEARNLRDREAKSAQQISALENSLANKSNQLADLLAENSRLKTNPNETELLKLRDEVTRLRPLQEDVALQKMLQQTSTGLPTWDTNELADAGRATPIDALKTYLYSSKNTNLVEIQNCIIGDDVDPPSQDALQTFINDESNHPMAGEGESGYKILSETWLGPGKVQVELQVTYGSSKMGISVPLTLRNINGEWKLVAFNIRDQNGKWNRLGLIDDSPGP